MKQSPDCKDKTYFCRERSVIIIKLWYQLVVRELKLIVISKLVHFFYTIYILIKILHFTRWILIEFNWLCFFQLECYLLH